MNLLEELKKQEAAEEQNAAPSTEADEALIAYEQRIERWMAKRSKCITSSNLSKLNSKGKSKDQEWGETAKAILYGLKRGLRTGLIPDQKDMWQMRHGKEYEPVAIQYLRDNPGKIEAVLNGKVKEIIHCSEDLPDIEFLQPFEGFGDSPDALIILEDGRRWRAEVKCPVDGEKIEKLLDETIFHDKLEYFDQMIGHLIGDPEAEGVLFINFDAFANDVHILPLHRKDVSAQIEKQVKRIKQGYYYVKQCLASKEFKISDINNFNFDEHAI